MTIRSTAISVCAVLIAFAVAGCTTIEPPGGRSASRTTQPALPIAMDEQIDAPPLVWPARWGSRRTGSQGVTVALDGPLGDWAAGRIGPNGRLRADPNDEAQVLALADGRARGPYGYRFEGPSSFVFLRPDQRMPERFQREPSTPAGDEPDELFAFVSASEAEEGPAFARDRIEIQRTWFAVYDADESKPVKGTVLFLPGLYGAPTGINDEIVGEANRDGWTVIRMLAPPSRFTQRRVIKVPDWDAIPAAGREAARVLDSRVAEIAYAAEAALERVHARKNFLRAFPVAMYASSGSALAGPAVATRLAGVIDAAVLVAGGAGLVSIAERSGFASMVDSVQFEWAGDPTEALPDMVIAELERAYLRESSLDPYHAGAALYGVPTLMIHAAKDGVVPAGNGNLLWERLGRPERWSDPIGHTLIFLTLHTKTGRVLDWLDRKIAGRIAGVNEDRP